MDGKDDSPAPDESMYSFVNARTNEWVLSQSDDSVPLDEDDTCSFVVLPEHHSENTTVLEMQTCEDDYNSTCQPGMTAELAKTSIPLAQENLEAENDINEKHLSLADKMAEMFREMLSVPSLEVRLHSGRSGVVQLGDAVRQVWFLRPVGGVHWPKKSLTVLPMVHFGAETQVLSEEERAWYQRVVAAVHCLANIRVRESDGQLMCETRCCVAPGLVLTPPHASNSWSGWQLRVRWQVCTRAWPPMPLTLPMNTVLRLQEAPTVSDGFQVWQVHFESPGSEEVGGVPEVRKPHSESSTSSEVETLATTEPQQSSPVQVENLTEIAPVAVTHSTIPCSDPFKPADPQITAPNNVSIASNFNRFDSISSREPLPPAPCPTDPFSGLDIFDVRTLVQMAPGPMPLPSATPVSPPPEPSNVSRPPLRVLREMGFTDISLNSILLNKYDGDMDRVVAHLLEEV